MTQDATKIAVAAAEQFRYRAFLSHSHADKRFARKLHHRLETYVLPNSLLPDGGTGRLGKIYLDHEDSGAESNLPAAVQRALADSEALIVVVSRASLQSLWVRQEVRAFKELRPAGNIFCISAPGHGGLPLGDLLEGAEASADLLIDMPAEPLVVNVDELGFEDGSLALIAALFGRGYDELRNRERRRQRRRRRTWTVVISAIIAVILVLAALSVVAAIQSSRERNRALSGQSELLAAQAMEALRAGDATLAARLSLAALPSENLDRPMAWQAAVALSRAAQQLRTVHRVDHSGDRLEMLAESALKPGLRLGVSQAGKLYLDGPGDAHEVLQLKAEKGGVKMALYAAKHALVVAQSGKQLLGWSEASRTENAKALPDEPNCLTLTSDGSAVVVTTTSQVEILRLPDLATLHQIALPPGTVGECALFSPVRNTAVIATMTAEGKHLLDLVNVVNLSRAHLGTLNDMAFNMAIAPDDSAAAVAVGDNSVLFWKLDGVPELRRLAVTETPLLTVPVSLAFARGGELLLIGDNAGGVHFFDTKTRQRTDVFAEHTESILSLVVDSATAVVHTSDSNGIGRSWSMKRMLERRTMSAQQNDGHESVMSRSGNRLVTAFVDGGVAEWDTKDLAKPMAVTRPCGNALRRIAVSYDGATLAAGCDKGAIFKWASGGGAVTQIHDAGGAVDDLRFSAEGHLRFAARSGRFGEVRPDGRVFETRNDESTNRIAEILGTARVLVVDQQGKGIIHDLNSGQIVRRLVGSPGGRIVNQSSLDGAVTDSGRYAAVGGADDRLRIWDLADGALVLDAPFERGSRDALTAGPNDQVAFIQKGLVHVWWPGLTAPRVLPGSFSSSAVAFVPGRPRHLAVVSRRQTVWLWDLDAERPYAQVALRSPDEGAGIASDIFFGGVNGALVGFTTPAGPRVGQTPPQTALLAEDMKRYAPLVAGGLSMQDVRRFALPMDSILRQRSTPVFGVPWLDDVSDTAVKWIGKFDQSLQ